MITATLVTKIFLAALCIKSLLEAWLEAKNKNHILANRRAVPDKFSDSISLEDHQKAADYSVAKIKVGNVFQFYGLAILLLWTLGGGIEAVNKYVVDLKLGPIVSGLVFFAIFGTISTLLSLPQSIYSTFVTEEKFGFNKMTPKLFIIDLLKGLGVGAVIGTPILAAMLFFLGKFEDSWWWIAWIFLTSVQFILIWAYPRFIAPIFNKFEPLKEGPTKDKVLGLLDRTGFTSNGLFVMNASIRSSHGNAYFTGFGKNKRIVFFDTLINSLEAEEVEAVLAHELGHFKRKHIIKGLARSIFFSFVAFGILGVLIKSPAFFGGHGVETISHYSGLCLFMMVSGIYTFFMTPLSAFFSRKYEFEADEFASQYSSATSLITALVKMYKDNASTLTPDPTYSAFYHSHPPALIRVKHLESLNN